ncbi:MAG: Rid family detoxifying hydrolase [bacterium]|nr:Rid family detoxifying hydrolase [bacterium]
MSRRALESAPGAPQAVGPYSPAVVAGDLVFCAGQIGLDPATTTLVAGGTAAQAAQALQNLDAVLAAAGCGRDDVVKTTVFLVDAADGKLVNELYGRHFRAPYPARSTVVVAGLPLGARVEIEAIALRPTA